VATVATATRTTEEEGDTGAEAAAGPAGRPSTKPAAQGGSRIQPF
jgi:hypothetical protein